MVELDHHQTTPVEEFYGPCQHLVDLRHMGNHVAGNHDVSGPEVPTDGRSRLSTEELAPRRYASSNGSLHNVSRRVYPEYLPPFFPKRLEKRSVIASHLDDQAVPVPSATP